MQIAERHTTRCLNLSDILNHQSQNTTSLDNVIKSIRCVNSVFNVKPYKPTIMDMEKLKERGHIITSFQTEVIRIEYISEDATVHAPYIPMEVYFYK